MSEVKTLHYERYIFRLIKQERKEAFQSFVERLQSQIKKCFFLDANSQLKDQIIEKCSINELRQKAFESEMTLEEIIFTGRMLETASENCKVCPSKARRNNSPIRNDRTDKKTRRSPSREHKSTRPSRRESTSAKNQCSRCGFDGHIMYDRNCPARDSLCSICKKIGHYERQCYFRKRRRNSRSRSRSCTIEHNRRSPRFSSQKRESSSSMEYRRKRSRESTIVKHEKNSKVDNCFDEDDAAKTNKTILKTIIKDKVEGNEIGVEPSSKEKPEGNADNSYFEVIDTRKSVSDIKIEQNKLETDEDMTQPVNEAPQSFYDAVIGGMPSKITVEPSNPINLMSTAMFQKMRAGKYLFFTADTLPMKTSSFELCGQFTAKIEINKIFQLISFFVKEGTEDYAIINKKMSLLFGLPSE